MANRRTALGHRQRQRRRSPFAAVERNFSSIFGAFVAVAVAVAVVAVAAAVVVVVF